MPWCKISAPSGTDRRPGRAVSQGHPGWRQAEGSALGASVTQQPVRVQPGQYRSLGSPLCRDNPGQGWELPPQPACQPAPSTPVLPTARYWGAQHRLPPSHTRQNGEHWEKKRKKIKCTKKDPLKLLYSARKATLESQSGKPLPLHHAKTSVKSPSLLPGMWERGPGVPKLRDAPGQGLQGERRPRGSR